MARGTWSPKLLLALVSMCLACGDTSAFALGGLECDDIVVAAIVEDDEVVGAVKGLGCESLRVSAPSDGQVVVWVLHPERVIESDGRQAAGVFERIEASSSRSGPVERRGAGVCDRCTSPIDGDWIIAQPGDHCSPSRGLPVSVFDLGSGGLMPNPDAAWLESVRANTRISWTGDCVCQPSPALPPSEIEVCPLLPEAQAWPLEHHSAALGAGGWAGLFGRTRAQIVDPQGTIWAHDHLGDLYSSDVIGAAVLNAGDAARFIVAARSRADTDDLLPVDLFLARPAGLERKTDALAGDRSPWVHSLRALSPTSFLLAGSEMRPGGFGSQAERSGFVYLYDFPVDEEIPRRREGHEPRWPEGDEQKEDGIRDAVLTRAGTLVVMTVWGEFILQSGQSWRRLDAEPSPINLAFGFARMDTLGRTIFACRAGTSAPSGIVRIQLNESETDAEGTEVMSSLGTGCSSVERTPDGSAVRVVFPPNRIVDLDEEGVVQDLRMDLLPGFESLPANVGFHMYLSAADGSEAFFGNNFSTLFGHQGSPPARHLLGREEPASFRVRLADGTSPRSQVAFPMGQWPTIVELDPSSLCSNPNVRPVSIEGYPLGEVPEAALHLGESRYLVLTSSTTGLTAYWVDLEAARIDLVRTWNTVPMGDEYHLALLNPDAAILLAERSGLYELSHPLDPSADSDLRALALDLDDPAEPGPGIDAGPPEWRSLSVSGGIGWVAGHDALARIVPSPEGLRVEAYWKSRTMRTPFESVVPRFPEKRPTITSVDAECPDRVTLSVLEPWDGRLGEPDIYTMMWQIAPTGDRTAACLGTIDSSLGADEFEPTLLHTEMDLCGVDAFAGVNHIAQYRGDILAAFSTANGTRMLFDNASLQAGTSYALPNRMDRGRYHRADGLLWYSRANSDGIGVIAVP